jgi:ribosomal-protein-alanine N-acetyltransferase
VSEALALVPATALHADILAALHAEAFPAPWPPEAFLRLLSDGPRRGALAMIEDRPAGFILVQVLPDETEVLTLAVSPAWRRRSVGRRLMEWAIGAARESGSGRIILEVSETNLAARGLYAGLGFETVAERPDYYARPGSAEKAFLMELGLGCSRDIGQVN